MPGPSFTPDQRRARQAEVARLYLQGKTQLHIAQQLGVSRQQVGYDLVVIRKAWLKSQIRDFDAAKSKELARLDLLEATHWDAFERSLRDGGRTIEKTSERGDTTEKVSYCRDGNPKFLEGISKCIETRARILGFFDTKSDDNTGISPTDFAAMARAMVSATTGGDAPPGAGEAPSEPSAA